MEELFLYIGNIKYCPFLKTENFKEERVVLKSQCKNK